MTDQEKAPAVGDGEGFEGSGYPIQTTGTDSSAPRLADALDVLRSTPIEPPPTIEPLAEPLTDEDADRFAAELGCVKCGTPTDRRSGTGHPTCRSCASAPPADEYVEDWSDDYGLRRLRLRPASSIRHVRKRWIWDKRIPTGTLTLLAGDGGVGKSTLTADVVAKITRGTLPGEYHGTPRVVWWLTAEEDAGTVRSRLHAAQADLDFVKIVTVQIEGQGDAPIVIPDDLALLRDAVATDRPALMVLDAFNDFLVGSIDSHKDHSLRQALTPLTMFAEDADVAVWALMHLNKGAGLSGGSRLMGSAGYRNKARSLFIFGKEPETGALYLVHDKANYGPQQVTLEYRLVSVSITDDNGEPEDIGRAEYVGEAEHVGARDVLGVPTQDDDEGTHPEEWLLEHIAATPNPSWDAIASAGKEAGGWTEKQLRTRRSKLRKAGLIDYVREDFQGPYRWTVTDKGREDLARLACLAFPVSGTGNLGKLEGNHGDGKPSEDTFECASCGSPATAYTPAGDPVCDLCNARSMSDLFGEAS